MASKRKQRQRGCKIRLISFSYMSKGQGGKEGQVSKMKIMTLDIRRKLIWSNNAQYLTDRWPVKLKLNFYPICTSKLHCFYFLNKTGIWKIWWGLKKKDLAFSVTCCHFVQKRSCPCHLIKVIKLEFLHYLYILTVLLQQNYIIMGYQKTKKEKIDTVTITYSLILSLFVQNTIWSLFKLE